MTTFVYPNSWFLSNCDVVCSNVPFNLTPLQWIKKNPRNIRFLRVHRKNASVRDYIIRNHPSLVREIWDCPELHLTRVQTPLGKELIEATFDLSMCDLNFRRNVLHQRLPNYF